MRCNNKELQVKIENYQKDKNYSIITTNNIILIDNNIKYNPSYYFKLKIYQDFIINIFKYILIQINTNIKK